MKILHLLIFALLLPFSALSSNAEPEYRLVTVVEGLDRPWAHEFLPNGDILITERAGTIAIIRNGNRVGNVANTPTVYFAGQGGLLDIMLDREFTTNRRLYLSLAVGERDANAAQLVSATLRSTDDGYALENLTTLFTAAPFKSTGHHYGARIAQLNDGSLVMTVGDGYNYREQAQTLDNHFGKTVRVNADGSIPSDNPFVQTANALPEIYSLGHRNQQAILQANGQLLQHEHGPQGGDELNVIVAGQNYGWPIATRGIDYNGARISPFSSYDGMQSPKINWTPSIAPSSMAFHQGHLFVTTLAERSIRKIRIDNDKFVDLGIVYDRLNERLRDIVSGPDGHLTVLTDADNARLVRIEHITHSDR